MSGNFHLLLNDAFVVLPKGGLFLLLCAPPLFQVTFGYHFPLLFTVLEDNLLRAIYCREIINELLVVSLLVL